MSETAVLSRRLFTRLVGTQPWTTMDTHSNKATYKLTVLKPDTTYQVKVLTQCLSKLHKSNELITVRTPEGREYQLRPGVQLGDRCMLYYMF